MSRRIVHAIECGVDHRWAALYTAVATRMVKHLDRSVNLEVDIKELEYFLLAPDEPNVDVKHVALQARGDGHQTLFRTFARPGGHEIGVASAARASHTSKSARSSAKRLRE